MTKLLNIIGYAIGVLISIGCAHTNPSSYEFHEAHRRIDDDGMKLSYYLQDAIRGEENAKRCESELLVEEYSSLKNELMFMLVAKIRGDYSFNEALFRKQLGRLAELNKKLDSLSCELPALASR